MQITLMQEQHIKELAILEKECFSSPWSQNSLREELENENACFLVALENEEVLGYVGSHIVLGEAYITNIAVFPLQRKKGIAKKLIKALCEKAEYSVSLEVRSSNKIAISLYESLGFTLCGKRKNFYDKPIEDALIFTRDSFSPN